MAGSFDGEVISDMVQLAEFTSWLRRSSRNDTCILVSQKPDGKPVVSMDRIRKRVGKRVSVTMLSNSVQQSAYKQLGTVNPYNGSIRIFPAGDGWTTDPRLARFVRGDLPVAEFLESVGEQLDFALVDSVRRSMAAQPRMSVPAGSWKASRRDVPNPSPVVEESSGPRLADVRGRNKLYRIDMAHASVAIGFMMRRSREVPCILVSLPADRPEPYLDVDALLDEIGDDAAVLQIVDHETDEWLNSRLPEQLRAYDGACRFLPPHEWRIGARLCRLNGSEDSAKAVVRLSEQVLDAAYADGYTVGGDAVGDDGGNPVRSVPDGATRAKVAMIVDDAVYADTGDRMPQRINAVSAVERSGIPVGRLVRKGQSVPVVRTPDGGFELVPEWRGSSEALSGYMPGATIVGVASAVYSDMFVTTLYPALDGAPAVEAKVHGPELLAGSGLDPHADLRPIIRKGEAVALRVEERSSNEWLFSLPSDGDKPVPLAGLMDGGPAWVDPSDAFAYLKRLRENRSLADMPLDELLGSIDSLEAARDTVRRLHERLRTVERLNRELESANENLRRSNDGLRKDKRGYEKAQDNTNPLAPFTGLFPSMREELDWQLQAQSLLQFNVAERMARPLDEWSYMPGFFDSLEECEHGDMSRMSLLHTMLFVLMGRDDLNGARTHRLREGGGGDDPDRLDENGNYIYRVNVHGQYRLHFTRDSEHHVTFRSVGTHESELR